MLLAVRELADLLPLGFRVLEEEDHTTLVCDYCGEEYVWMCHRVTPGAIRAQAAEHYRCCPKWHGRDK